ncbi:hypothetical protein FHS91_002743 [Sphingobium xanthum]
MQNESTIAMRQPDKTGFISDRCSYPAFFAATAASQVVHSIARPG